MRAGIRSARIRSCFLSRIKAIAFLPRSSCAGLTVQFHANFLCIEAVHQEIGCNGVLFNDVYGVPVVDLDNAQARGVCRLNCRG